MDTKRLVRAYSTIPVAAFLGAAVGAVAGGVFGAALLVLAPEHDPWNAEALVGADAMPFLGGYVGAWFGAFGGFACGIIGRLLGGPVGWGVGGLAGALGMGAILGPVLVWIPGIAGLVLGAVLGSAIRRGSSCLRPLRWAASYLHDWDHLATVGEAGTRSEAEALRDRLRSQGMAPVMTGADMDAVTRRLGRRQPIRIHVPERHAVAASELLAAPAVATELEAASPPEGVGTELEAAGAPEGRGDEPMADGDGPRELPPRLLGGPG